MKITKSLSAAFISLALATVSLTGCSGNSTSTATSGTTSTANNSSAATSATSTSAATSSAVSSADSTAASTVSTADSAASKTDTTSKTVIKVGASSTPHAEILETVKDALAEQGYDLQIKIYDDYVLPNKALSDGEIDANYFQHTPYLNNYNKENSTDLVAAASIHYEPFGLYGKDIKSKDEIKEGATITIPADGSNETRALLLLKQEGLIDLKEGANATDGVTDLDITDNHGYVIKPVQADTVAAQFKNGDAGSLAVINGNYALAAGLSIKDSIAQEDASGDAAQTYANIIAVRKGDETNEKTQALVNALKTDSVKKFIEDKYQGAVVAIF